MDFGTVLTNGQKVPADTGLLATGAATFDCSYPFSSPPLSAPSAPPACCSKLHGFILFYFVQVLRGSLQDRVIEKRDRPWRRAIADKLTTNNLLGLHFDVRKLQAKRSTKSLINGRELSDRVLFSYA